MTCQSKKCTCDRCNQYNKWKPLENFLKDKDENLLEIFEDMVSTIIHTEMDLNYEQAIIDNTWPSAREQMATKGWFRTQTEHEHNYVVIGETPHGDEVQCCTLCNKYNITK